VVRLSKQTEAKLSGAIVTQLRRLTHDLSNSLEVILQASYLLGELELDGKPSEWVRLIDEASQDAARANRAIREILRSQNQEPEAASSRASHPS